MEQENLSPFDELTYPCDFDIKVIGDKSDDFEIAVLTILKQHMSEQETSISQKVSKNSKYLSLTLSLRVTSKDQLMAVYRDLKACPLVRMAL